MEDPFASLLLGLDLLPPLAHALGGTRVGVTEDVRVPADELCVHHTGDGLQVALVFFLEQKREEENLEQQVAQLVDQLLGCLGERGVGDLVGLLDRVRDERANSLLAIPGALAPQALGQLSQVEQRISDTPSRCRASGQRAPC